MFKRLFQSSGGQLRLNIVSGMLSSGVGAVLMAASYPYYLSRLGYRTYGVWIALTIVISMSQLGNLGIAQALVKKIAEHSQPPENVEIAKYYSSAVSTLFSVALVLFAGLFLAKTYILHLIGLSANDAATYSLLATGIFALSVSTFVIDVAAVILSGIGRVDLYNYSQMTVQGVSIITAVVLLSFRATLTSMLMAQIAGYTAGLMFALIMVRRQLDHWPLRISYFSARHLRELLGQGSMLMGAWVFSLLFHPVNKILLGQAGFFEALPAYEIAVNLSMRLRNFFEAGQRALMPEASRLIGVGAGDLSQFRNLLTRSVKSLFYMAGPVYAIIFLVAEPLTRLWLKHAYSPIVPGTLRVFLVGTFLSLIGTPFYYGLIGAGRAQGVLYANAIQFAINVTGVYSVLHLLRMAAGTELYAVLGVGDCALGIGTTVLLLAMRATLRNKRTPQLKLDPVAA